MSNNTDSDKISRARSLHSQVKKKANPISVRVDFIKNLLKDKCLETMVNFDDTATENFIGPSKDNNNNDYDSQDTRYVLNRKTKDLEKVISQIGGKLFYIKSGTTGHTFRGEGIDDEGNPFFYALKVTALPKKARYGSRDDVRRPENSEVHMYKVLSYFVAKKQTPHIILPIGTFDTSIDYFVDLIEKEVVDPDNKKFKEFVEKYEKGIYHDNVSILISEYANKGDFLEFTKKYYTRFSLEIWRVFFFQLLSVLAVVQLKFPSFRHNDLKANNVLVHKIPKKKKINRYTVDSHVYDVPNIRYQLKICDFDFACIPGVVDNKKVYDDWTTEIGVTPKQNRYYDMHYFFNTLIKRGFCPDIMTSPKIPKEVREFILRVVPKKFQTEKDGIVAKRGRILIDDEYLLPNDVLKNDPFFEPFRNQEKTKKFKERLTNKTRSSSSRQKKIPTYKTFKPLKEEENLDEMLDLLVDTKKSHKNKKTHRSKARTKAKIYKKSKLDKILLSDSSN